MNRTLLTHAHLLPPRGKVGAGAVETRKFTSSSMFVSWIGHSPGGRPSRSSYNGLRSILDRCIGMHYKYFHDAVILEFSEIRPAAHLGCFQYLDISLLAGRR